MNKTFSHCCEAKVIMGDICSDCKEHCETIEVCECSRCKGNAFSDTWTEADGEFFCEECAEILRDKMEAVRL